MVQVCTCTDNFNPTCPIHGKPQEVTLTTYTLCDLCETKKALAELKMRVQETIMQAQTDTDEDGWITAYHFKTGAIHRLLKDVRG